MDMFVGGRRTPAFDAALIASLGELQAVVLERAAFADPQQQYEWAAGRDHPAAQLRGRPAELPTLRMTELPSYVGLYIRGPRSPLWHIGLARRLSARLGVWAGALVNDRLQDDYGYGLFYAGHVVELAVRTIMRPVMMSSAAIERWFDRSVEEANREHFFAATDALGDITDPGYLMSSGPVEVLGLGAADGGSLYDYDDRTAETSATARAWIDIALPPPVTQAVIVDRGDAHVAVARTLAGWELAVEPVDEFERTAAILRAHGTAPLHELLAAFAPIAAPATVVRVGGPSTVAHTWCKAAGEPWHHEVAHGATAIAAAYEPTTERALRWDCR